MPGHACVAAVRNARLAGIEGQLGVANSGNAGMAWHTIVITKSTNTVMWQIDGVTIATVTNDPLNLSTNIFIGYQDIFSSGSISDVPLMSFGLVDNLRVETYSAAAPVTTPVITGINIVGANVEITFTGSAGDTGSSFKLTSSSTVNGSYLNDNSAVLTNPSSGSFKAVTAMSGGTKFYRIKR